MEFFKDELIFDNNIKEPNMDTFYLAVKFSIMGSPRSLLTTYSSEVELIDMYMNGGIDTSIQNYTIQCV